MPGAEREVWILRRIVQGELSCFVPPGRATVLGESQAGDFRSRAQPQSGGCNLQAHPLSGFGKFAGLHFFGRSFLAEVDDLLVAPVGALRPFLLHSILQHDGFGEIGRVEINVGKQFVAGTNRQRLSCFLEKDLVNVGPLCVLWPVHR